MQGASEFIPAFTRQGLAFLHKRDRNNMERARDRELRRTQSRQDGKPPPEPHSCLVDRLADEDYDHCFIAVDPAAGAQFFFFFS